ncbi:prepilin-type N-terminal cleavage/methylation domain-containing protein [Pseudomonas alcaligenes]|uniref:Prepilin-type N-terminal cleavage/methylation domain-containing protein n=2 Tax=Aquipseudomonas alcaligenes TaxID=43263 RepID=A0ABR7S660_AQUAC|nr:prepilin-type N-terminal cleavage/methylation domain-containing protein [Pseudomonas alcaligenes]
MTLVELVITIVIVGIAAAAMFSAMAAITGRSADPLLRQQSLAIAEAYLEEILLQPFLDPAAGTVCPAAPASRASYDNVCDYNGLNDNGARDARGQAITALSAYRVQASVAAQAWESLASADVLYVQVTVTDPAGQQLVLGGYRTRY